MVYAHTVYKDPQDTFFAIRVNGPFGFVFEATYLYDDEMASCFDDIVWNVSLPFDDVLREIKFDALKWGIELSQAEKDYIYELYVNAFKADHNLD
jgi:hypothetical protein